ncbi:hypothetical protein Rsub_02492 [Raphidocelis subcapitata]|uniref:Peroxisomal nicotinamide adenine dinucleotide carrier n=1 Tax=Raphidocelis subcapitata TaxID=307507 RepID=A0A2V0NRX4_9CHLO|nr:hypothetical protein Rsub_02492 [Raphidocelis subcapitata]|eukprot:GBF90386.1 hypothetical protein Rsub_02492 [Raphidocelis subcapitata]
MASQQALVEAVSGGIGSLVALVATYPLKTIYTLRAIRAIREESDARRAPSEGGAAAAAAADAGEGAEPAAAAPAADAAAADATAADAELRAVVSSPLAALCALCRRRLAAADLAALYAGAGPAAAETVASTVVYFYLYSHLKQAALLLQRRRGGSGADLGVLAALGVAALAGAGNMLVTTPAQVVTTVMMANAKRRQQLQSAGRAVDHVRCDAAGVCREIWERDGAGGFWRGLLPSLILVINPAVQYALFEWGMTRARAAKGRRHAAAAAAAAGAARGGRAGGGAAPAAALGAAEVFLIGSLAKIGATYITYPMIVVKSRLQATNQHTHADNRYAGTADAVARIAREEGAAGFYAGLREKILQTALNAGLMLALKDRINSASQQLLATWAAAAAADAAAAAAPAAPPLGGAPIGAFAATARAVVVISR